MENLSCSLNLLAHVLLLLLVTLFLLSLKFRQARKNRRPSLPPGPWRLPVIGSLHHLIKAPLIHRRLADLARRYNAPIMYLQLGELPVVVISSPDAAREVMKTHDVTFASRPLSTSVRATIADGLGVAFSPYGERWRQLRKFHMLELLSAKRVRSFRPIREDETARLVADIAACPPGEPVNVTARVATLVSDSALRAMMGPGERFKHRDELLEATTVAMKIVSGFNMGDLFPSSRLVCAIDGTVRKALGFHRKLVELVDHAIEQHRERRLGETVANVAVDEDFLHVLLRLQEKGGLDCSLSMGDIKAILAELFIAGSESTSTTIQWAMAELMRNPSVMERAQTELHCALQGKSRVTEDDLVNLPYIKLIIKETLRLHTPGPLLLPRECTESCEILGYDVLKGTIVLVNAWTICRDPKYWEEPEVFKPERFKEGAIDVMGTDFCYTPFGAGRRICPGIAFALANMELVLAVLLFHFDWQLPPGVMPRELDMEEEMGVSIRRKRDLYLHPTLRVPLQAYFSH